MKYIVALCTGGLMESPEIEYKDFQNIEANNPVEAKKIYDRINCCSFYYGEVVGYIDAAGNRCMIKDIR